MRNYIAHLARDANPLETACGEPWQGWQAPTNLDLQPAWMPNRATLPPRDQPRPHVDAIRQCQACMRVAITP